MLPELFVAPPWVINKKTNVIPVFDLPVLPIPAVTDITPGITELISHTDISRFSEIAQFQSSQQTLFTDLPLIEKESWETSFIPFTPEQQILWQLGFNEWLHCEDDLHEKKYIPQSAVDALLRFDFPALKAEFAKYHNNANKSWNLSALCYLPGQQAISFLNQIIIEERYSGEKEILAVFGSTAIPAFMTCLQRDHQRLWIFTLFIGASELALPMAQRLQKKMAYKDAVNWLANNPRHATAGLLPLALGKPCQNREYARRALRLLVKLNQRETIEEIARRYNQPDVLAALATLFDSDPLEEYPAKIAPPPGFYQFTLWADQT